MRYDESRTGERIKFQQSSTTRKCHMSLLYFNSQQRHRIRDASESGTPYLDCMEANYARIDTFISVAQLIGRLRQSHYDILGAVLIISSMSELIELIQNQEFLEDIPVFLVLPVDDPEVNSLGHALRPRYLTSAGHDELEIRDVLVQFIRKLKEQFRDLNGAARSDDQE